MKILLRNWKAVISGLCVFPLVSCKPSEVPPATTSASHITAYDMRGVITHLGTEAAPRRLIIHHEATKDMESMTMAFAVDENVPLTGLAVGDKISFRYEIDQKSFEEHVTKVEKLPADTVLNLPAEPAAATAPAPGATK